MPNFNPFSSDNEDSSFEQGAPVSQAAKNAVKTASSQSQAAVQATTDDIVNMLYGPSTPQDQGTDEANTQHSDQSNAATRAVAAAQSGSHRGPSSTPSPNVNQTPEEQAQMEKVRHELFGNYSAKYRTAQNGPFNITTSLDQEMEKARKEREQKETQRKQEEEEEERRKQEEEEQQQQLEMPAGKKTGVMMGKKQQQPVALTMAKTKTESNRGASG